MGLAVLSLERMLVIHLGSLSASGMGLLCGLVVLEPSGDGLLVLGVKEIADLFDISDHCTRTSSSVSAKPQSSNYARETHRRQHGIARSPVDKRFATTSGLQHAVPYY